MFQILVFVDGGRVVVVAVEEICFGIVTGDSAGGRWALASLARGIVLLARSC